MSEIGMRVRQALTAKGISQKRLAQEVGMTADALSRAINGQRGFGAVELADIAANLGAEVHFLITGERDPYGLVVSARHDYDPQSSTRTVGGLEADRAVLEDIRLAYAQAML